MTQLHLTAATPEFALGSASPLADQSIAATRFFDRPDGRIAYDDSGTGPLVVMVPASATFAASTASSRHASRQRATGWSPWTSVATANRAPAGRTIRPSAIGGDVAALVAHVAGGPAIVVGTSLGAGAAVVAAATSPQNVAGLILIGPFVRDVPLPLSMRVILAVALNVAFVGPWGPAAWGAYYASLYPSRKTG